MAGEQVTRDGQIEWRGLLIGAGSVYRITNLAGWLDMPAVRAGDVPLDNQHGAQAGQMLLDPRTITLDLYISEDHSVFTEAVTALRRATAPDENPAEEPLVIHWHGIKAQVWARCERRQPPREAHRAVGYGHGAIQWRATNPRILHLPQLAPSAPAPTPGAGGLVWPLVWPLVWGDAPSGGELLLTNAGNAHAQPVWRITGPCTGPVIRNSDSGAQLVFDPAYVLPAGQRLTLTHDGRSVLLDSGVSRSNKLLQRGWFTLPPETTTRVRFETEDGQGSLECLYHPTSL